MKDLPKLPSLIFFSTAVFCVLNAEIFFMNVLFTNGSSAKKQSAG